MPHTLVEKNLLAHELQARLQRWSETHGVTYYGIASCLVLRSVWQAVPQTIRIELAGRTGSFVTGKDVILAVIGRIGVGGGTNAVLEFVGPGAEALSVDERLAFANMAVEAGSRRGSSRPTTPWRRISMDGRACPGRRSAPGRGRRVPSEANLSALEPLVALPHLPCNVTTVSDAARVPSVPSGSSPSMTSSSSYIRRIAGSASSVVHSLARLNDVVLAGDPKSVRQSVRQLDTKTVDCHGRTRTRGGRRGRPANPYGRARNGSITTEGRGFEPPRRLHAERFSRPPHSTALPPLRCREPSRPTAASCPDSHPQPGRACGLPRLDVAPSEAGLAGAIPRLPRRGARRSAGRPTTSGEGVRVRSRAGLGRRARSDRRGRRATPSRRGRVRGGAGHRENRCAEHDHRGVAPCRRFSSNTKLRVTLNVFGHSSSG